MHVSNEESDRLISVMLTDYVNLYRELFHLTFIYLFLINVYFLNN